ncbi:ABC transporter permease [Priestia aryabhattai]|uniref:ABC transporter permease n=1 Tax=Priestia aryabhattai TaxID=412384 RepID=UPI0030D2A676
MFQLLNKEFRNIVTPKFIIVWFLLILAPVIYTLSTVKQYSLLDRLDLYELHLSTILPLLFPLIVVLIYLANFSGETKNNFLSYTRLRIDIKQYLRTKLIANNIIVFIIMFSFVFIPFLFAFYIEPSLGIINFEPENSGLNAAQLLNNSYNRFTFSQLLEYGTFTYGFLYSAWVGLNGIVYATLGFFALLLINNRFLALSIPFLLYHLGSFIIAVVNVPMVLLDASIFPFNISQYPIWTAFIQLLFLCCIIFSLYIYTNKNLYRLDNVK